MKEPLYTGCAPLPPRSGVADNVYGILRLVIDENNFLSFIPLESHRGITSASLK